MAWTSGDSDTSAATKRASPPTSLIRPTVSSPPSRLMSATTTRAPSRAKILADARPSPPAAPVTIATLPSSAPMFSSSRCICLYLVQLPALGGLHAAGEELTVETGQGDGVGTVKDNRAEANTGHL